MKSRKNIGRCELSEIETMFEWMLRASKIEGWEREYRFHPKRRWRFDFAWPNHIFKFALEIEGGTWNKGRHVRGKGFEDDCEKYNEALLLGWRVIRVTTKQVEVGKALEWVERLLK